MRHYVNRFYGPSLYQSEQVPGMIERYTAANHWLQKARSTRLEDWGPPSSWLTRSTNCTKSTLRSDER